MRLAISLMLAFPIASMLGQSTLDSEPLDPVSQQAFATEPSAQSEASSPSQTDVSASSASTSATREGAVMASGVDESSFDTPSLLDRLTDQVASLFPVGVPGARDKVVLTLATSLGYDTNVLYTAHNQIKSATANANAVLDYKFGSPRLKLQTQLSGGTTYYNNRPGDSDDQNFRLVLGADYQVNQRLTISFNTDSAYLAQPDPQLVGGVSQYQGSYFYTDTSLGLQYSLRPRWALTASFEANSTNYDEEAVNKFSGYSQQVYSLGANFLFSPRSTIIFQYRFNPIHYYTDGLGSDGHYLTLGLTQILSPKLTLSLSGGAEYRKLKSTVDNGRDSYLGPFFEGNLAYQSGPDFVINGNMRFGTEPSGAASVSIRTTFRTGLSVSKTFGKHFEFGGGLFYSRSDNDQPAPATDFTQDFFSGSLDFKYRFSRATALTLHYDYNVATASIPDSGYTRGFSSIGLEVIF
jgi:hypothetical protein